MSKTYSIVNATDLGGLKVYLVFSDGMERIVDIGAFLRKHPHAQHNKYLDPKEFAKFRIVDGNIVWGRDGDLIFAIDELHDGLELSGNDTSDNNELLTQLYGPVGTPERDKIDNAARLQHKANEIGQKILLMRLEQGLSKKELADKAMIDESTVSKVENGHSFSFSAIGRILRALGATSGTLDLGSFGRVALW